MIHRRRPAEPDDHLRAGHRQALPGADVERHALPAPGVDLQLQRGIGLHLRVRRDPLLLAVAAELAADDAPRVQRLIAFSTLTFSSRTDSLSVRDRRLHRQVGQHLEEVVLDHVADGARLS